MIPKRKMRELDRNLASGNRVRDAVYTAFVSGKKHSLSDIRKATGATEGQVMEAVDFLLAKTVIPERYFFPLSDEYVAKKSERRSGSSAAGKSKRSGSKRHFFGSMQKPESYRPYRGAAEYLAANYSVRLKRKPGVPIDLEAVRQAGFPLSAVTRAARILIDIGKAKPSDFLHMRRPRRRKNKA